VYAQSPCHGLFSTTDVSAEVRATVCYDVYAQVRLHGLERITLKFEREMAKFQIAWSEPLVILLLKCIQQFGPHVASPKEKDNAWKKVLIAFYEDPLAAGLTRPDEDAVINYDKRKKPWRKLEDKFKNIIEGVQQEQGWGEFYGGRTQNLSKFDGEPGELHLRMKAILQEIEDKEEEAEAKAAQDGKLKKITASVLDPSASHAKKRPRKTLEESGSESSKRSIMSNLSDRSGVPAMNFEHWMMECLQKDIDVVETEEQKTQRHQVVFKKVIAAIYHVGVRNPVDFQREAGASDAAEQLMTGPIDIPMIVSIYCDRAHEYNSEFFDQRMTRLGFFLGDILRIYNFLEELRLNKAFDSLVHDDRVVFEE
jgi:hypothetical protein